MTYQRRIAILVLALVNTLLVGTVGYELLEGWSWFDALYMTVITLATVGYGETHPLSPVGRLFTIFLILSSMGTVSYGLLTLTTLVADGELARVLKRKRMDKMIAKLRGHYLVCGAGITGEHIINELLETGKSIVVIDNNAKRLEPYHSRESLSTYLGFSNSQGEVHYVEGDATREQTLLEAGLNHAQGIFCALSSDQDNLFVVLTARGLNADIRIISKSVSDESEHKFMRAGASGVVSPLRIGGLRMASEMLRPTVVSFLDVMLRDARHVRFEEIAVAAGSPWIGRTLGESPAGTSAEARPVGLFPPGNQACQYNPPPQARLENGTRIILLTTVAELQRLREAFNRAG